MKSLLMAGVGAGLLARVPLSPEALIPISQSPVFMGGSDLDLVNYLLHTRIWPKYQAQMVGYNHAKNNLKLYMEKLGTDKLVSFERLVAKDFPNVRTYVDKAIT